MRFVFALIGFLFLIFSGQLQGQDKALVHPLDEWANIEKKNHASPNFKESQNTRNYDVTYYALHLEVNPTSTFIMGNVTVKFTTNETLSEIFLDLTNTFQVDSVVQSGFALTFTHEDDQIRIQGSFPLNTLHSITVFYQGNPPVNSTAYTIGTHNTTPILWTLSEPYGAREWWPCKQSLTDKADSVDVFVTAPAENKVAGNGILISETHPSSQAITTHWKCRYPIVPYLVAIAVTPYAEINFESQLPQGNLQVQNYVYLEDSINVIDELQATDSMLLLFDSLVGAYPFMNEKYGHAQFERGGGMEHQTMSFMTHFGFDLVAHELAHQWFGNKITCGSWQDLWLNEGFATYFTGISHQFLRGDSSFFQWKKQALEIIIRAPGGSVFIEDTANVSRLFDPRLTYRKGAYVLHMLRHKVGDDDFFTGVTNYLNDPKLAYKTALTDDFFAHISTQSGQDLTQFKNEWIYGQGFPSYAIEWNQTGQNFTFTINQVTSHPSVPFFHINVPILCVNSLGDSLLFEISPTETNQSFTFPVDFEVENVIIDPNLDLISKSNFAIETSLLEPFQVYPNPTSTALNFYTGTSTGKPIRYQIYAVDGQLLIDKELALNHNESIDVSSLPQGMYTLIIRQEKGEIVQNFMVTR